jgi:DNA-binding CsgD family transcriptional regulator
MAPMAESIQALSEREKEALRLLLGGHDAKSIARELGLSVHTVNERLRDARRKTGVSSSREAARLLAASEQSGPKSLGDKQFGVARVPAGMSTIGPLRPGRNNHVLAWLTGGMLVMSLIIAAAVLSSAFHPSAGPTQQPSTIVASSALSAADRQTANSASTWVTLVDQRQWSQSWDATGALFKSRMPRAQWVSTIEQVRQPLGSVSSRTLQSVTSTSSLPGAPAGAYEIVQFETNFAQKPAAVETVILAHEGPGWRVEGYFIR